MLDGPHGIFEAPHEALSIGDQHETTLDSLITMSQDNGTVPDTDRDEARRLYASDIIFRSVTSQKIELLLRLGRVEDATHLKETLGIT